MQQQAFVIPEDELRELAKSDGITHLSTGVAVVRDGKVLVVRRHPDDFLGGVYELPGGGIEDGESFAASVAREVLEETGLRVEAVVGMFPGFDYSTPKKPKVRQFNFLVTAKSQDVHLSPEHDNFVWVASDDDIDALALTPAMKACIRDALEVAQDFADMFEKGAA